MEKSLEKSLLVFECVLHVHCLFKVLDNLLANVDNLNNDTNLNGIFDFEDIKIRLQSFVKQRNTLNRCIKSAIPFLKKV